MGAKLDKVVEGVDEKLERRDLALWAGSKSRRLVPPAAPPGGT